MTVNHIGESYNFGELFIKKQLDFSLSQTVDLAQKKTTQVSKVTQAVCSSHYLPRGVFQINNMTISSLQLAANIFPAPIQQPTHTNSDIIKNRRHLIS